MAESKRGGFSWELLGMLAVLAILLVGGIVWAVWPSAGDEPLPPDHVTLDPALDVPTGVTDDGYPYLGSPDAGLKVYEFGDFECRRCKEFAEGDSDTLVAEYVAPGDVQLVWVGLGLTGEGSRSAAKAGVCAAEQGQFWPMHDWLFANQSSVAGGAEFADDRLLAMADGAGLDVEAFSECLHDPATDERVNEAESLATEKGATGAPSFLVGGTLIEGADLDALREAIDAALEE
jgi:protein-disulfide isomerase